MGEVAPDIIEQLLGVALPVEVARVLRAARVLAPPRRLPPVGPLVDAPHGASADSSGTDLSPQKVLRSSNSPQLSGLQRRFPVTSGDQRQGRNRRPDGILARLAGGGDGESAYRRGSVPYAVWPGLCLLAGKWVATCRDTGLLARVTRGRASPGPVTDIGEKGRCFRLPPLFDTHDMLAPEPPSARDGSVSPDLRAEATSDRLSPQSVGCSCARSLLAATRVPTGRIIAGHEERSTAGYVIGALEDEMP